MAELTNLETKLGEVIGLAMAAQAATERVEKLTTDRKLVSALNTMRKGARTLVGTHLPIQKRHFKDVSAASLLLAAKEDANA